MTHLDRLKLIMQRKAQIIAEVARPGAKVTIIVRHPDHAGAVLIVTDDDEAGITQALSEAKWAT